MTHLVFVYGSLKEGFHNHALLAGNEADPLGAAVTALPYLMVKGFGFPYLIDPATLKHKANLAGKIGRVRGELYAMDDEALSALDRLEGHPDYYRRETVTVRPEDHPEMVDAWLYFLPDPSDVIGRRLPAYETVAPAADGTLNWTPADVIAFDAEDD